MLGLGKVILPEKLFLWLEINPFLFFHPNKITLHLEFIPKNKKKDSIEMFEMRVQVFD